MTAPKLQYILRGLKDHPNEWLSAGELAMICRQYSTRSPTASEIGVILCDEKPTGIERVRVSVSRTRSVFKYRYTGAGTGGAARVES